MSAECFVDTNILFYAYDLQSGAKHEKARQLITELWASRSGVLSTQVLQELCVNLQRKGALPSDQIRTALEDLLKWKVIINTGGSILDALELGSRHQLSFWDALIVQAAMSAGVTTLYTEDLSDGQSYGTVRAINPLK